MSARIATLIVTASLAAVGAAHVARGQSLDVGEECTLALDRPRPPSGAAPDPSLRGRALGAVARAQCEQHLRSAAIPFDSLTSVAGVEQPVRLRGPIREGFVIRTRGREPHVRAQPGQAAADPRLDAIFDCRLVLALHTWSAWARDAGFVAIEHVSTFRPHSRVASTGRPSGHSHALAIDVLTLVRLDGTRFSIEPDWVERERGGDPCVAREETIEQARVRGLACRGMQDGLFQVVITPHHDDRHANHLHLEVRPDVDWAIIR